MITQTLEGRLLQTGSTRCRLPINVHLSYDPDENPLAVTMVVSEAGLLDPERIPWEFALDLLQEGSVSHEAVGQGDVKIRIGNEPSTLLICLTSHEGHADLGLPMRAVRSFLANVQPATERCSALLGEQIDELIEEIYNA